MVVFFLFLEILQLVEGSNKMLIVHFRLF